MKKKKVLICGASGFIGRNLFEALSKRRDLEVWGTYHTNRFIEHHHLMRADLTEAGEAHRVMEGMDVVIQAAAVTAGAKEIVERPYIFVTDNAIMNARVLQAAYDRAIPQFIFPSCSVMYQPDTGRKVKESDFDPNEELHPNYFGAGWTKVYVEKLCEFYSRLGRTKFTVIRHSNIYGPHDKYDFERSHVFGATITKVMVADTEVAVWGNGTEERDLLHVDDLIRLIEIVLGRDDYAFELVNAGLGKSVPIRSLVKKIIAASGKNLSIKYDLSKPTIPTKLVLAIGKARRKFGWSPRISLEEGIKKTLAWRIKEVKKS